MTVTVPTDFDYSVRTDTRLQQAINGDSGGEVRKMLDNATWAYARAGRRTVLDISPADATPGTRAKITTTKTSGDSYEDRFKMWLELSADTTGVTWSAWADDCDVQVQFYDDLAESTSLATTSDSTTGEAEITANADLSSRTGSTVRVVVRLRSATGTAADALLYNLTMYEDDLTSGELPT